MPSNTLNTVFGFLRSFTARRSPFKQTSTSIDDIYNYLPIANLFATSGQPSESQFGLIRDAGFNTVINLAPNSILENSLVNERAVLKTLGMKYIHIPVDFKKPTEEDFEKFLNSLQNVADDKIWVHCAANMRVSAFTYRYRCTVLREDEKVADRDLQKIWQPFGVWKTFVRR